jgi:RNA polymerase sigma factor (sigma-70 family)
MVQSDTVELLRRWHAGDRGALEMLLARHLESLHQFARAELGRELRQLRRDCDSMDIVQTAAARVLGYIPTFIPENGRQFHRLLQRIVANDILNRLRSPNVGCREPSRESFGDSVLDLRGPRQASNGPVSVLLASERLQELRAWARVALEFLRDPLERRLMLLAAVEEWSWKEIGDDLHLAPDAARMRFQRLLPKLANHIRLLGEGRIDELLDGDRSESAPSSAFDSAR